MNTNFNIENNLGTVKFSGYKEFVNRHFDMAVKKNNTIINIAYEFYTPTETGCIYDVSYKTWVEIPGTLSRFHGGGKGSCIQWVRNLLEKESNLDETTINTIVDAYVRAVDIVDCYANGRVA